MTAAPARKGHLARGVEIHESDMDAILVNALRQAVDEWFTRWRTFAEQGDQPPQHWQEIVSAVSSATWQRFDFTTGAWHPINFDE